METTIHRIGNSQGILLPKPLLVQLGLTEGTLELTVEKDAIVLRKPRKRVRDGWAEAAKRIAKTHDDELVWPELANDTDRDLVW